MNIDNIMCSTSRIPESYSEYEKAVMSNFDHTIDKEVAKHIKYKDLFSVYSGFNFNGKVWWQNNLWNCEVWTYRSYHQTFNAETLDEIIIDVCFEYGSD